MSERPVRAPMPPLLVLGVAVIGMGWAGPLVRYSDAPAIAIAAWRLVFALVVIGAVLAVRGVPVRPSRAQLGAALAAGAMLAAHFWTWIASIELTTVSSSVALVSMQPVFVALLSAFVLHETPTRRQWLGIVTAMLGALVIGWGDFGRGPDPLAGDALALLAALLVSGYYIIGRRLRQTLDVWSYTGLVYGMAACVLLLGVAGRPDVPLLAYPGREWLIFVLLALLPTLLGHSGANYALRFLPAYVVNLAVLGEPVIATVLAWTLPGIRETPPSQTVAGGLLILAGIGLGFWRRRTPRGGAAGHAGPETAGMPDPDMDAHTETEHPSDEAR